MVNLDVDADFKSREKEKLINNNGKHQAISLQTNIYESLRFISIFVSRFADDWDRLNAAYCFFFDYRIDWFAQSLFSLFIKYRERSTADNQWSNQKVTIANVVWE